MEPVASAAHDPPAAGGLPPGLPADWVYAGDVECPRCRYNLRARRVPRCPECGTLHTWQTLLGVSCPRCGLALGDHVGHACSGCGLALNWRELLDGADPRGARVMEYSPRPVRAALGDWWISRDPSRFWARLRLESRPNLGRLRGLRLGILGVLVGGAILGMFTDVLGSLAAPGARVVLRRTRFTPDWDLACIVTCLIAFPHALARRALPRFTATLEKLQIRREQFARVSTYSMFGIAAAGVALGVLSGGVILLRALGVDAGFDARWWTDCLAGIADLRWWPRSALPSGGSWAVLVPYLWAWQARFHYVGLRAYLRLDRRSALGITLGAHIIAALAAVLLMVWVTAGRAWLGWR